MQELRNVMEPQSHYISPEPVHIFFLSVSTAVTVLHQ